MQRPRGGRADGGERRVALLPEELGTVAHRVGAPEDDEIEATELAEPGGRCPRIGDRPDVESGKSRDRGALGLERPGAGAG
jgi:hypothetical protein